LRGSTGKDARTLAEFDRLRMENRESKIPPVDIWATNPAMRLCLASSVIAKVSCTTCTACRPLRALKREMPGRGTRDREYLKKKECSVKID
jgi:hypothetical protein